MEHLLNQTVTIQTFNKLDENGDKTFTTTTGVKARVVVGDILIMQPTGENRVIKGKMQVMGNVAIKRNDKVTYSGTVFGVEEVHSKVGRDGDVLFKLVYLE